MKIRINNILMWFATLGMLATASILSTACSKTSPSPLPFGQDYSSPYADYINERTFSIYTGDEAGTGWIFKKSTDGDYSYYIGTNVHVISDFVEHPDYNLGLGYNPDFTKRNIVDWEHPDDNYFPISTDHFSVLGTGLTGANKRPMIVPNATYGQSSYECDVDFDIIHVDFGTADNIKNHDPNKIGSTSPLLDRLNRLNKVASKNQGKICNFVDSSYNFDNLLDNGFHVAGFPVRLISHNNADAPRWTSYHTTLSGHDYGFTPDNLPLDPNTLVWGDGINGSLLYKELEFTPYTTPEFTGGASGSIMIDNDYNVVGIFNSAAVGFPFTPQDCGLVLDASNPAIFGANSYNVWNFYTDLH